MKKVCVIGGGAAGLTAAYFAAANGHAVTLLEKNEKLGKKIYVTGKGRCNITNLVSPVDFLENVVRGKKFLSSAIYSFPPEKTVEFFENNGLQTKTERGNRVFPVSDKASDVTKTLERACKTVGVQIRLHEEVKRLLITMSDDIAMPRIVGVATANGEEYFDEVIVATGGLSYPATGSTGDGYRFAKEVGLSVTDLKTGLCGLNLKGDFFRELQGLALKNVAIKAFVGKKKIYDGFGEALFTHFGISGPLVLTLSSLINRLDLKTTQIYLDVKPALDENTLDKRILRDFDECKNKKTENALMKLLPQKLIPVYLKAANISPEKSVNAITKEERSRLVKTLKNFPLPVVSLRDFSEAIITSGGVELSQIDPKSMAVKGIDGLRFCGEVLDADAFTGGFNLQIAFSTGFLAGNSIK